MKRYERHELEVALTWALIGHQALVMFFHHHGKEQGGVGWRCAKLFDADQARLLRTARELGIHLAVIRYDVGLDRYGRLVEAQHIDVFGQPLTRAIALCRRERSARDGRAR